MCTVSIIPLRDPSDDRPAGFRLVTNRDESRARPRALPPRDHLLACGTLARWPLDPAAGGTWVSVNSHGVALAILNIYGPAPVPSRPRSRGHVIPALASAPSAADAAARLASMNLPDFAGFRLVAADPASVIECRWEPGQLLVCEAPLSACCFSSHGFGDRFARHRLRLFGALASRGALTPVEQDAFHRHRWAMRPEVSVRMARDDARTTSITSVEVRLKKGEAMRVRMDHEDLLESPHAPAAAPPALTEAPPVASPFAPAGAA
ncbi:MAG: NRDE family protein [Planctomycetes bacterium]|nr:NRDE family protein [Planctomycetota bacterium]